MALLNVYEGEAALAAAAAVRLLSLIGDAVRSRGSACVSLTGGRTPRELYARLADESSSGRAAIDWSRVHLFWGDERHVPPEHPESNFGMAHEALLRHVPIPDANVHRMRGELADAREAAAAYESELRSGFAAADRRDLTFDVMLLGVGDDGHIASVFPGGPLVADGRDAAPADRVAAVWAPHLEAWRVTLTPAAILDARAILVVVAGAAKAAAVRAALELPPDIPRYPVQLLRGADDRVEWLIDRAAASSLRNP